MQLKPVAVQLLVLEFDTTCEEMQKYLDEQTHAVMSDKYKDLLQRRRIRRHVPTVREPAELLVSFLKQHPIYSTSRYKGVGISAYIGEGLSLKVPPPGVTYSETFTNIDAPPLLSNIYNYARKREPSFITMTCIRCQKKLLQITRYDELQLCPRCARLCMNCGHLAGDHGPERRCYFSPTYLLRPGQWWYESRRNGTFRDLR